MSINKLEIIKIRKKLGLSQPELGKILGVSKTSVSNWENGVHKMGLSEEKVLRMLSMEHDQNIDRNEVNSNQNSKNETLMKELIETQKKYIKKLEEELQVVKKQNIFPIKSQPEKDETSGA